MLLFQIRIGLITIIIAITKKKLIIYWVIFRTFVIIIKNDN